jgi:hypothetical protein
MTPLTPRRQWLGAEQQGEHAPFGFRAQRRAPALSKYVASGSGEVSRQAGQRGPVLDTPCSAVERENGVRREVASS